MSHLLNEHKKIIDYLMMNAIIGLVRMTDYFSEGFS